MEVERSHPQAEHISAVLVYYFLGNDNVALGLVHYLALAVNYPAVGADCLIGCFSGGSYGGQQRTLEPASVLVAALKVEVSRPAKLRTLLQNRSVGAAGIEPNIENIHFLAELIAAAFALNVGGYELGRILAVPCV